MKLSDRLRPDVEAAPWVIEEVKKLEQERAEFMRYDTFFRMLKERAMHETIYEDSEGRMILVICPLDLYIFVSRLWER